MGRRGVAYIFEKYGSVLWRALHQRFGATHRYQIKGLLQRHQTRGRLVFLPRRAEPADVYRHGCVDAGND